MLRGNTIPKTHPTDCSKENYLSGYVLRTSNRSQLLHSLRSQTFRCIFTSPTSSREEPNIDDDAAEPNGPPAKKRHTRRNVANILKMQSVQPRAIAYAAVQVSHLRLFHLLHSPKGQTSASLRSV